MMETLYRYAVWLIATLFVVYSFALSTAYAVFSHAIQLALRTSTFGTSIASGAFILGFAVMQIPAGYLLDKCNARYVVSGGIFILTLGNALISFSDSLLMYSLCNFIQGIGASFAFISASVLIAQWFPVNQFPILFGLTQSVSCILAGIIHYGLAIVLKTHSWRHIFQFAAFFGLLLFIASIALVKSPPIPKTAPRFTFAESLVKTLKNSQLILCAFAAALSFGVLLAYANLWYVNVQTFYSVDNLHAVIIGGMIFFGIGVGTPILGWISNLLKSRTLVIHVTLCLGTMALLLGIYLPHFNVKTLAITHIISFFIGFFLSGAMLFYTLVSEISTDLTRGLAISITNATVFLFNTLMLFIPYLFLTRGSTHFYTYLWILPFFLLCSILILFFIRDSSPFEPMSDSKGEAK